MALVVLLAATLGQAAYIWYLQQDRPGAASATGHLRVDGPEGAQVRVDGARIGTAPLAHALSPGDYQVQIGADAAAHPVTIEGSSTVVLLPLGTMAPDAAADDAPTSAITPTSAAPPGSPQRTATPVQGQPAPTASPLAPAPAAGNAGISATRGGVVIQSTPSGLPVTMEGRERGVTPVTIGQLRPGRHDVLVGGLARKVDITANQLTTLHVTTP